MMSVAVLCGLALVNKVNAQLAVGVKGGVNIAGVSKFSDDARIGANAGIFVHAPVNSHFCIQPEVLYSSQGGRYNGENGERTLALSYIQVPVMFQYYPVKQFYIEAGPQVAFLTNAQTKGNGNDVDVNSAYKKADFDINVGAGVRLTQNVGVYARYNIGVADITTSDNTISRNQVGQVGAYIRLAHLSGH